MATITFTIPDAALPKVQATATALGYANAAAWLKATLREACSAYDATVAASDSGKTAKDQTAALFGP